MSALAIPSQTLWTPRSGSWWRLPLWATAGKLQHKASSGKVQRGTDGKLKENTASTTSCCCATGTPCFACTGSAPATWTLTVSGITLCACDATSCVFGGSSVVVGDPNGTWTLTQYSGHSDCAWHYTMTTSECALNVFNAVNAICSGAPDVVDTFTWDFYHAGSGIWDLLCYADTYSLCAHLWSDSTVSHSGTVCHSDANSTNELTTCAVGNAAHGGTAVLTPNI